MKEVEVSAADVRTTKRGGRLFVICPACKRRSYLGMWEAAHLSECDMSTTHRCGARLTIRREEAS